MSTGIIYAPGSAPPTAISVIAGSQTTDYKYTVPAGYMQRMLSMFFTFTAGSTAGTRLIGYQIQGLDGSTTVVGDQSSPSTTLNVVSTAGFPTGGNLSVSSLSGSLRYSGVTPTSFTGITNFTNNTGDVSGTATNGSAVLQTAPYIYMGHMSTAISANQTTNVSISPRAPQVVLPNTAQTISMHMPNIWLWPGSTIATNTNGILAGDQYTTMNLFLEQVPIGSYAFA